VNTHQTDTLHCCRQPILKHEVKRKLHVTNTCLKLIWS